MLYYFLTSRVTRNSSQLILFAIQYLVPAAILLENQDGLPPNLGAAGFATLASFFLVYEIGYVFNDYFDRNGPRIQAAFPKTKIGATAVILVNVVAVTLLVSLGNVAVSQIFLLGGFLVLFAAHTACRPEHRTLTFFLLNVGKIIFVGSVIAATPHLQAAPIALALALPQTWKYWAAKTKRTFVPSNWLSMSLSLLFAALLSGALSAVLACVSLFVLFLLSVRSKVQAARRRFRTLISHSHTDLSHDATLTLADYEGIPHHVYLTDHAEDVNLASFLSLKADAQKFNEKFTVGLEFQWAREHILAINLKAPVMHPIDVLPQIADASDELIWAHPNPAFRRMLNQPHYRQEIWSIFKHVDSVEWFNVKMQQRRSSFGLRMAAWAIAFHFAKGARRFYIGADLHNPMDLSRLKEISERISRSLPSTTLVDKPEAF